ncbi:hypothetical protein CgunFtcFv8_013450 [Champsocephalus gunnari]|uniref:Uncharacterized protein n=1 Tax=Champsocephalus gunnari TaxID=52237 RepID=A0AAN8DXD1_CHAGU|nr:hypothetical protein CgunFtcFv8_013450 [Champsocephalus gunnari]
MNNTVFALVSHLSDDDNEKPANSGKSQLQTLVRERSCFQTACEIKVSGSSSGKTNKKPSKPYPRASIPMWCTA